MDVMTETQSTKASAPAARDGHAPLRVLLISHTCRSKAMGQPKAHWLGGLPGVELRVLVPERWQNDDGSWVEVDQPESETFSLEVGKVRWPYVGPFKRYLHHYPKLAKTLREFKPDIIDIWEEPWGFVSAHACWLRKRICPNAKIISETEQNINKKLPLPFERCRRYSLSQADHVVARSSEALQVTRDKGFTGPGTVVPNAVDADLFVPMNRAECRAKVGVDGFVVGYIGRMIQEKGLEDLLHAVALCQKQGATKVNALFVGGGDFLPALQALTQQLGIVDQVKFLPARKLSELPEMFNAMDAFVLASRTTPGWKEQFGRVIIEAHACGIPVIGSNSGAIPEVVGQGGVIVPEQNPQALADAMIELSQNPPRCAEMGRVGRAEVEERFTWQRVASRMYDVYRQLVPIAHG